MTNDNIEAKVATTLLDMPDVVKIGNKEYKVAPPSIGTLILISREIARMPDVEISDETSMLQAFAVAKDCAAIGRILAILILGARRIKHHKPGLLQRIFHLDPLERLTQEILVNLSVADINNLLARSMTHLGITDFFALSTFLKEINMTRATRKVAHEATASGASSSAPSKA